MDSNSTTIWTTLAATLLGAGAATLLTVGSDVLRPSWDGLAIVAAIASITLGALIFLLLLSAYLRGLAAAPLVAYQRRRQDRITREGRYMQTLLCKICGHVFKERVKFTEQGWLPETGAERRCPDCGNTAGGFEGVESVPLNKEAKKRGSL